MIATNFLKANFEFGTTFAQAGALNKGDGVPDYCPAPQTLPEKTDEAMEFDVYQLDPAGRRFYCGLGWISSRSGIDMPPGVSRAETTATGGSPFVLPERKAKKPAAEKKSKKKLSVNGVKSPSTGATTKTCRRARCRPTRQSARRTRAANGPGSGRARAWRS